MAKRKRSDGRLEPLKIGPLASREYAEKLIAERAAEKLRRLNDLREQYGIPDGPHAWLLLAMRLAEKYEPTLQEAPSPGRPKEWTDFENVMLAGELSRELHNGARNQTDAARRLSQREPWVAFLKRRKRKKGGGSRKADAGDTILTQYRKMDQRHRRLGEETFDLATQVGRLEKWEALVGQILEPGPSTK